MGKVTRGRHALRLFSPEQYRTLLRMQKMVKAHPQAEADMRRFSEAAFERDMLTLDPETFPVVSWDQPAVE